MAKVITDAKKIESVLSRGVEEIIVKKHLKDAILSGKKLRVKLGIDPTSPNIHLGRAVVLRKLRAFQELGHEVVFIVGDFTGQIGDTSDKDSERPMLSEQEVKKNLKTYFEQAFKIVDKSKTETHYNSEWLSKLNFLEIGEIANLFGWHEFEARENVARRLKLGKRVSLREVLYPLMQGYDSVAVRADLELGGTDQKFNMLAARTIQPHYKQNPQDIMITKLMMGTDGRKMSSSWGNVINITDSAEDMFGKTMSVPDSFVREYFILATDLDEDEIDMYERELSPRDVKAELAFEIVKLYHGDPAAGAARESFKKIFSEKETPENAPEIKIGKDEISILDLVILSGAVKSKSEARRLIEQGGVDLDGMAKSDPAEIFKSKGGEVLKIGKKNFFRLRRFAQ